MKTVLSTENISKYYQGQPVIDQISIQLQEGELVALLGVSGSGKSTLFNVIAGLLEPEEGRVLLSSEDITGRTGLFSYMQQKDLLLPHKTIIDNVSLPLRIKGQSKKEARAKAASLMAKFELEGSESKYPHQLSGGMRQRAALLRTHLFAGQIMLLDEPFSALDAITKRKLHLWFLQLIKELKTSTLFITHDIDEALLLADRIYILTGVPGRIENEILIQRPADSSTDFSTTSDFLAYKKQIINLLHL